jgi:hypothetical protein
MSDIKLTLGLREGVLVDVANAERGLACACVCPSCKERLVARKGKITRHHFAHQRGVQCDKAVETALHFAAKEILAVNREILLPAVYIRFSSHRDPVVLAEEGNFVLDEVRLERRTGDIIPDVLAFCRGIPLMVEIRVTHAVDSAKLQKIRAMGISAVEIDLSGPCFNLSRDTLTDFIVRQTANKTWLFNAKAEEYKRQFMQTAEKKMTIQRGLALHVDHCPINTRNFRGKSYANVMDDCVHCDHALEFGIENAFIMCGGRNKIKTLDELRAFNRTR